MHKPNLIEQINRFRAKSINGHCLSADEVFYLAFDLWRASSIVRTIMSCFAFKTHQRSATLRTTADEFHFVAQHETTGICIHTRNLGNDLATGVITPVLPTWNVT